MYTGRHAHAHIRLYAYTHAQAQAHTHTHILPQERLDIVRGEYTRMVSTRLN